MDAMDIEIMEIYNEITGVTNALYHLPLSKGDGEGLIKECCEKMDNWYAKVDLWLNCKTDDEMMMMLRTDTIRTFLYIADLYLHDNKAAFSDMDIEKGYYNIDDYFYMHLEKWYKITKKRFKMVEENIVNWMESHQNVTPTQPQPEAEKAAQEPQQVTLPMELDNDEAAKYFAKAIEIGVMDNSYNWRKGLQLLSCFAREMSLKLGLSKAQNSDRTQRISWKPFEQLFGIEKGKLRSNYNDIQKTGQEPKDIELINMIFE